MGLRILNSTFWRYIYLEFVSHSHRIGHHSYVNSKSGVLSWLSSMIYQ
jgi:hypothetical protein